MAGLGCGNGVLATAAGVLVAQASPAARRGEALSVYFLATALSFAAGPPLGLALYGRGGIRPCFVAALGLGALIALLILTLRSPGLEPVPPQGFRWFSRRALPAAAIVVCVNIGYSSIYAFLPLYALASGLEGRVVSCSSRSAHHRPAHLRGLPTGSGWPLIVRLLALTTLSYLSSPAATGRRGGRDHAWGRRGYFYPTLLALLVDRTPEPIGLRLGTLPAPSTSAACSLALVGFTVRGLLAAGFTPPLPAPCRPQCSCGGAALGLRRSTLG